MEMNDILNGLNSCDDSCTDSTFSTNSSCSSGFGTPNCAGNFGGGCGFSSWIWILLILFYCGGGNGFLGGYGRKNDCCCEKRYDDCCCERKNDNGLLGNCSVYLFLLVILFLCNGWGSCNQGISGFAN